MRKRLYESEFVKRRAEQLEQQGRTQELLSQAREANSKTSGKRVTLSKENKWEKLHRFLKKEKAKAKKHADAASSRDKNYFLMKMNFIEQLIEEVARIKEGG